MEALNIQTIIKVDEIDVPKEIKDTKIDFKIDMNA